MNQLQRQLYDNLMTIVNDSEAFFYVDQVLSGYTYRIFNYRLASYTQWLHPGALECRGITFMIDDNENALALVSWPFEKFFNYHEVTTDINTLAEGLVANGYLSREVFEKVKKENNC